MTGFTFVAVGIFLATVIHQIVANPVVTSLPDIDSSLLVLMGISQGGYLGKKLVTFGAPVLRARRPTRYRRRVASRCNDGAARRIGDGADE